MLRQINTASGDRVGVNALQLLPHHCLAENQLGMHAFLPELKLTVALVRRLWFPR